LNHANGFGIVTALAKALAIVPMTEKLNILCY